MDSVFDKLHVFGVMQYLAGYGLAAILLVDFPMVFGVIMTAIFNSLASAALLKLPSTGLNQTIACEGTSRKALPPISLLSLLWRETYFLQAILCIF